MPSRAYTSFLRGDEAYCRLLNSPGVNALSGLYIISTFKPPNPNGVNIDIGVNALSGLYIISTEETKMSKEAKNSVSMPSQAYTSFLHKKLNIFVSTVNSVNALSGLYIISTHTSLPTLSGQRLCQCPLRLIHHFYGTPSKT